MRSIAQRSVGSLPARGSDLLTQNRRYQASVNAHGRTKSLAVMA